MNAAANVLANRSDWNIIASWVQPGERVLDLGCGDGSLLKLLIEQRGARGYGVEIDAQGVLAAIRNGINVVQTDIDHGLAEFKDNAFEHVVLSRTLQTVKHTENTLREMLRVGREAVVSVPNFGYWKNRQAVLNGRMPVSEDLPYQWYDTPNVRFFTLADFEALCAQMGIAVRTREVLDAKGQPVQEEHNFLGSLGVYRIAKA
jgi:methionine biosynthesis protein MetW